MKGGSAGEPEQSKSKDTGLDREQTEGKAITLGSFNGNPKIRGCLIR